jgi:hypothetical protein
MTLSVRQQKWSFNVWGPRNEIWLTCTDHVRESHHGTSVGHPSRRRRRLFVVAVAVAVVLWWGFIHHQRISCATRHTDRNGTTYYSTPSLHVCLLLLFFCSSFHSPHSKGYDMMSLQTPKPLKSLQSLVPMLNNPCYLNKHLQTQLQVRVSLHTSRTSLATT